MNKQDIAAIRKELKPDNTMLKVKELYSVYLKKDNQSSIYSEFNFFEAIDSEKQELYIKNFKKLLTGTLDSKLFQLSFSSEDEGMQKNLYEIVENKNKDTFIENCDKVIKAIGENFKYDTDVVVTFMKSEYWKGSKRRSKEAEEALDDSVSAFEFILCSVNKIEQSKKALHFDYENQEFSTNSSLDITVNLNSPLDGFMFPCFNNNCADVNNVLYYSSKVQTVNSAFVENVLKCVVGKTAQEEKEEFNAVLKNVVGDKITPEMMQNIYEKLSDKLEEEEEGEVPVVSKNELKEVLEKSGIESTEKLEEAFKEVLGDTNYDFKVQNIVPDLNSKSIKIASETMNITLSPKDLKTIKQVKNKNGSKCLLIELNEDIVIDGFNIETEEI